jgi:OOP family OmpA-OmpF porin
MYKWGPTNHMLELGGWLGILIPNDEHEFYDPRVVAHTPFDPVAADLGIRFAYFPLRFIGAEIETGLMPTRTDTDESALLYAVRGHVIGRLPWWRLAPFLLVGGGGMGVGSDDDAVGDDIDRSFHWGPGLEFFINKWLAARLDFRHLVGAREGIDAGVTHHFEVLAGLSVTFRLGKKPASKTRSEGDPDGDGFHGHDDRCPDEAGTHPDGCPAPDSDGDCVADADDACPDEPGPAPEGCPAEDRDGDGVADEADECPDQAGTKPHGCPPDSDGDGVRDPDDRCPDRAGTEPDGCPPDGDGDGVYDPDDRCPTEPETQNSYEDDDGCADEVPRKLRGAVGVLPGITFETNSARIKPSSRRALDEAVRVLENNPKYDLEIVGHTDSTGDREYNIELSQRRADAVRDYLVRHGVDSDRVHTKGRGPDRPVADNDTAEGRAQNRRIEFKVRRRVRRKKRR